MHEPDLEIDAVATAMAHDQMPFAKELGLEVISARADEVRARADWSPLRCTTAGMLHGGFLMAAADSMGAVCKLVSRSTQTQAVIGA